MSFFSDLDRFFFFLCLLCTSFGAVDSADEPPRGILLRKALFCKNGRSHLFVHVEDDAPSVVEMEAAAARTPTVVRGRVLGAIVVFSNSI